METLQAPRKTVSERSLHGALEMFMRDDDVVRTSTGELSNGLSAIPWVWPDISVSAAGPVAWLYADGEAVVSGPDGEYRSPPAHRHP